MKRLLSERNIVVVLFVMVLITFSLAQEDSKKKMTTIYTGIASDPGTRLLGIANDEVLPSSLNNSVTP